MTKTSRRSLLRTAPLALFGAGCVLRGAEAETAELKPVRQLKAYNTVLDSFVKETMSELSSHVRRGQPKAPVIRKAVEVADLYAKHLHWLGVDAASRELSAMLARVDLRYAAGENADALLDHFRAKDPSLTRDEVISALAFDRKDVLEAVQSFETRPYSSHFSRVAERMSRIARYVELSTAHHPRLRNPSTLASLRKQELRDNAGDRTMLAALTGVTVAGGWNGGADARVALNRHDKGIRDGAIASFKGKAAHSIVMAYASLASSPFVA